MSFLLRCLFWIGLAFSQIAAREGASFESVARPAAQSLADGAEQMKQRAIDSAVASCRDNTAACLAIAAKIHAPNEIHAPNAGPAPASRPAPERASRDTLRDADRMPAWRLRASSDGA